MSIKETLEKIKPFYNLLLILVIASIFFVLGRFSVENSQNSSETGIVVTYPNSEQTGASILVSTSSPKTVLGGQQATNTVNTGVIPEDGPVIGSKSGKKYYFPWCGTVKRIKPENQVHFDSIASAKLAGFTPGGNCKGLN